MLSSTFLGLSLSNWGRTGLKPVSQTSKVRALPLCHGFTIQTVVSVRCTFFLTVFLRHDRSCDKSGVYQIVIVLILPPLSLYPHGHPPKLVHAYGGVQDLV